MKWYYKDTYDCILGLKAKIDIQEYDGVKIWKFTTQNGKEIMSFLIPDCWAVYKIDMCKNKRKRIKQ